MKLHEYQAKQLFEEAGIVLPPGEVARNLDEVREIAGKLLDPARPGIMVKAQIHAGGRGKGGGVKRAETVEDAVKAAEAILGKPLVTPQTGPEGKVVNQVLLTPATKVLKEVYVAFLLDRAEERMVCIYSAEGGVEIEELAERSPDKIGKMEFSADAGLRPHQARLIASRLGFAKKDMLKGADVLLKLSRLFLNRDCSLVEVNPLALTDPDGVIPLDAKVTIEDNALFRQKDLADWMDETEEDPGTLAAASFGASYVKLEGEIGCMVNGAGLAMATVDALAETGRKPANFLDVGGGANAEQVEKAFRLLMADEDVKVALVNIFGGIMRCDVIAEGVVNACRKASPPFPIVVRLEGTKAEEGRKILAESGLEITPVTGFGNAAKKAAELCG